MPTLITHALVGAAAAQGARPGWKELRFTSAAVLCSVLPDLDVLGFRLGIHYGDQWGHRGMMHSITFAAVAAFVFAVLFGTPVGTDFWRKHWRPALLFFLVIVSHDVLDALTSGGLGIAFFAPFSNHRYFFPWTPIRVSPLGLHRFFSLRGIAVLWSEFLWVWIPTAATFFMAILWQRKRKTTMVDAGSAR